MDLTQLLPFLLIVGMAEDPPKGPSAPQAAPTDLSVVYLCRFDESNDQNYDGMPDFWTRATGPRYPLYVKSEIVSEPSPDSPRSLWGYLDGGSLALSSPPVTVTPLFSYQATVWVRSRGIHNDRISLSVELLDGGDHILRRLSSRELAETPRWTLLSVGPFDVDQPQITKAVLTLHVEAGGRADVGAEVWFGAVCLRRLPSLKVTLDRPDGLYPLSQKPRLICRAMGLLAPVQPLEVVITDALGRRVATLEMPLQTRPALREEEIPADPTLRNVALVQGAADCLLPLEQPGFYHVEVVLNGTAGLGRKADLRLVLMRPVDGSVLSPFGWSFPQGAGPMGFSHLRELIREGQVGFLKYPVWCDDQVDKHTLQETSFFLGNLASRGVHIVGLLTPPQSVRQKISPQATTLEVLGSDPAIWQPSLEFTFARLGSLIRAWQLGEDGEVILDNEVALRTVVDRITKALGSVAADIRLGVPWSWVRPSPRNQLAFVHLLAEPPLTAAELETLLRELPADGGSPQIFLDLTPLPADEYALVDRIRDLVLRMAASREGPVTAAYHRNPLDPQTGLFTPEGAPTELFLPWRTTALALGSARPLGSVTLPGGSSNRIFARDGEGVMLLWNSRPAREVLFLGERIFVTDVWGGEIPVKTTPLGQEILLDTWPVFVYGVSIPIARWRQEVRLEVVRFPSVYGVPYRNQVRWQNTFSVPVAGELVITTPGNWGVSPRRIVFQLQPNEIAQREVFFTLPFDAEAGVQPVRIDFRVQAEKTYRFSSYHFVEVGLGDVYMELATRLDPSGDLVVQQTFVNETPYPVTFRCELFAPDRRRQLTLIRDQGPGRLVQEYRFPNGRELVGKTLWLRAEEVGGSRVLNYRITATE